MENKYELTVTEPLGLVILDTPRPQSRGALKRRAVGVGSKLQAVDIYLFDGVPYAELVAQDPQKPEWARVGEVGSVSITDGKLKQHAGVKSYASVTQLRNDELLPVLEGGNDELAEAIKELAAAIVKLAGKMGK